MSFWSQWQDDKNTQPIAQVVTFVLVITLLGFYVNAQNNPAEQTRSMIYLIMLIWGSLFGIIDWSSKNQNNKVIAFVYLGSLKRLAIAGLVGIFFALFVTGAFFTAIPPETFGEPLLTMFYVVIIASYCEEKFFSSTVAPTAYRLFGGIPGLIITCVAFGFYHGYAYGWDYNMMLGAVVWRGAVLIGNQFFKSTGFGLFAHISNNARALGVI